MMHHLIKDEEIIQFLNHLFQIKGIHKKNRIRLRNFIETICYISRATGQFLLSDKGYDSNHFIETIQMQGFTPVIPPRKNRKNFRIYDKIWYQDRHKIECFFGKIKHFRRIATRYDKCATSFLSFLYFVGMLIWLR